MNQTVTIRLFLCKIKDKLDRSKGEGKRYTLFSTKINGRFYCNRKLDYGLECLINNYICESKLRDC